MLFDRILRRVSRNGRRKTDQEDLGLNEAMEAQQKVYDQSAELEERQARFDTRIKGLKNKLSGITPRSEIEGEIK